ncbi:coiled-coil domain-containing protein [Methylocystis sp. S23]
MAAPAYTFDRLAYVDRLKGGGIDEAQARAHADALDAAMRDTIATKADVDGLGRDLRREMAELGTDLRREITELGTDLRREIAEQGTDLRREIAEQGSDLRREMAELRAEFRGDMADVRREIKAVETQLDAKIDTSAANLKVDILRWLFVSQITLGGFIFAAMKFTR